MSASLLLQLGLAAATVATTAMVHLAGLAVLTKVLKVHKQHFMTRGARFNQALILLGAAFALFALHTLEVWGYAILYL
jgi:voltage-gated potassium channel